MAPSPVPKGRLAELKKSIRKNQLLLLMVLPGVLWCLIFRYGPMYGALIAFQKYRVGDSILNGRWAGLYWFNKLFSHRQFGQLIRNTLSISILQLIFCFPVPVVFALLLNEVKYVRLKKLVQTVSYLPHFISWIIISGISFQFLSAGGIINTVLMKVFGMAKPINFMTDPKLFWGLAVFLDIWKEMGWWTIIFLASIAGINPDLYEAAQIDGASRMQRIRFITLPNITSTIVVVLIMTIGNLLGGGLSGSNFEQSYLLGNSVNADTSEIIQTYVFKVGLQEGRYSYATAVGLIQSVISLILIFISNFVSKKIAGSGLF